MTPGQNLEGERPSASNMFITVIQGHLITQYDLATVCVTVRAQSTKVN
jgi:hypothetical protein